MPEIVSDSEHATFINTVRLRTVFSDKPARGRRPQAGGESRESRAVLDGRGEDDEFLLGVVGGMQDGELAVQLAKLWVVQVLVPELIGAISCRGHQARTSGLAA